MGLFDIFKRNLNTKTIELSFIIKGKVKYPKQNERWEKYGKYISNPLFAYCKDNSIEWFKDSQGNLDLIKIKCFNPNKVTDKKELKSFTLNLIGTILSSLKRVGLNGKFEGISGSNINLEGYMIQRVNSLKNKGNKKK